jgi:hypothetical protein
MKGRWSLLGIPESPLQFNYFDVCPVLMKINMKNKPILNY